jgi:hypothetical protein
LHAGGLGVPASFDRDLHLFQNSTCQDGAPWAVTHRGTPHVSYQPKAAGRRSRALQSLRSD